MHRTPEPELRELGTKTVLLLEELLELFAAVRGRLGGSPRGWEAAAAVPPGAPGGSIGTGARPAALQAELEALQRRVALLEQRFEEAVRPGAEAAEAAEAPGGRAAHVGTVRTVTTDSPGGRGQGGRDRGGGEAGRHGESRPRPLPRLAKEASRQLALEAAFRLKREGKALTLASVARAAGLKYSQVVYAFRRREDLLKAVGGEGGGGA